MSAGNPNQDREVIDPGRTYGLVSLVLSLLGLGLFGILFGVIGKDKSNKVGLKNKLANIGIFIGVLNVIAFISIFIIAIAFGFILFNKCNELGQGTHYVNGVKYSCNVSD